MAIALVLSEDKIRSGCVLMSTFVRLAKSANTPARNNAPSPAGDGTTSRTACNVPGSEGNWSGPCASLQATFRGDSTPRYVRNSNILPLKYPADEAAPLPPMQLLVVDPILAGVKVKKVFSTAKRPLT